MAFIQSYKDNKCVFLIIKRFFSPLFLEGVIVVKIIFCEWPPNLCQVSHVLRINLGIYW